MSVIVTGGDSFIWGSELQDTNKTTYSKQTFPALLSNYYGCEYICVASPGNSNDAIARTVISQLEGEYLNKVGVFVSWTFVGRYEFRFGETWNSINSWTIGKKYTDEKQLQLNKIVAECANNQQHIGEFANVFFKYVGTYEYYEIYSTLKEIVYLQNYLTVKKIPYLFTCLDSSFFDSFTCKHSDKVISSLIGQINLDDWFLFPGNTGFDTWSKCNNYQYGEWQHPLEEAHSAAFLLMKEKFNELVKRIV